jgi:hypothetical protein
MKRKRQVEIVLDALSECGVDMTDDIKNAVCKALKQIRAEKFAENQQSKWSVMRKRADEIREGNKVGT